MECPHCHAEIEPGYVFCPECGQRLTEGATVGETPPAPSAPSPAVEISIGTPTQAKPSPPPPVIQPPIHPAGPASSSTPGKKRTWLWIVIGLVGVLACLCLLVVGFWAIGNSSPLILPGGATGGSSGGSTSTTAPIEIVNNSNYEICYVLISPSRDDEWGDDWLGEDETILPGGSVTVWVPAGETYDLQLLDCGQNVLDEQYQVAIGADGITYTLGPGP